ncbi:MAG: hypothetical protein H8E76_01945 [Helicobacteraceae bacterium]|nr:hypothetical protein [Candidatus Sulfurimonas ponti]MBL6973118.1 hypothetical protein [Sulfurimonas sp.]
MRLSFRLKHHFFSAFRELFVHHHGSLEFRAKVFALIIAANNDSTVESYIKVKEIALKIYENDEERANLLMLTTKEKVNKVRENNGLDIDTLVANIQKDLKIIPRYAKKINLEELKKLIALSFDEDTISYQNNMLEFLETLKNDTLRKKEKQIAQDEETFKSQFSS